MSKIKLKHSSGNSVSIAGPSTNPAADRTINLNDNYAGNGSFVTADSSGNVGIGESSPDHLLHVKGSTPIVAVESSSWASGQSAALRLSYTDGNAREIRGHYDNGLGLFTNNGEALRVTPTGYVYGSNDGSFVGLSATAHGFRSTAANWTQFAYNTNAEPYGVYVLFSNSPDNRTSRFFQGQDGTTGRVIIYSDGDIENHDGSYGQTSDVKLKENIVDAKSQWDDIKAVKVRNFNFKISPDKKQIGVVAQELETVCPGLVKDNPDLDKDNKDLGTTTKSVKSSILYMKAIKALQEAMARIETLETKVAALEAA